MFYNLEQWASFGYDQVNTAWEAMHIVTRQDYPLLGMVAKATSGIHIGPLYYYYASLFYFLTRMDPVAAPIIAGVTSLFSFGVVYVVSKKLFDGRVALVSAFIYTCSSFIINFERAQLPINFIAPLSLFTLFFLHKVITGEPKYFLHLGAMVGLSFHIHFTAIFYPIIILTALPFVRWNKVSFKYFMGAIGVGALFFIPQIVYYLQANHTYELGAYNGYMLSNYHGFHLRRMLQLTPDAFIQFETVLMTPFVRYISYLFVPAFATAYISQERTRKRWLLTYLIALWFFIPWIVFTTYSGEISQYYFSLQSYVGVIMLAYLTVRIWDRRSIIFRILIAIYWLYWTSNNIRVFFNKTPGDFPKNRAAVLEAIRAGRVIQFSEGDPQSYLYYYYLYSRHKELPYKL